VVSFGRGQTLQMAPDGQIAEMLWGRLFERELRDFVSRYVRQGMRVINIGANSGLYTLMASQLVGDDGVVHAIEPSTENYARLQRNIELNRCRNVVAQKLALGDFEGVVSLRFDPKNPQLDGHFYVDKVKSGEVALNDIETVPCKTLDNYWKESYPAGPPPVDLIVIDVEGAELQVFKGALSTFNHSPKLAIYFECTQKIEEMEQLLRSSGFQFYEWDSTNSRLAAIRIKPGHVLAMRDPADSLASLNVST
jgi:FkbM family methyltransferase